MGQHGLSILEKLEINEILKYKTVCLTKHKMMYSLITNKELKSVMKKMIKYHMESISKLQSLLSEGPIQ